MSVKISTANYKGYLRIDVSGQVDCLEDLKHLSDMIHKKLRERQFPKVLVDESKISLSVALSDLYYLTDYFENRFSDEMRTTQVAIVLASKDKEIGDFWELAANNRGYPHQVFYDLNMASTWLENQ